MTRPFLCPLCSCPLQLLAEGNHGGTRGTIDDALEAHMAVVHKTEPEPLREA